ncbi:MAG: Bax inhibitor-1/YccA family protein [Phycisphaeraceae bacterium]|nr:Bax inhibitor-1/YccA family protein [Phycisphaeraceae bacterium]
MTALQSSNPILANESLFGALQEAQPAPQTATVSGVINKTTALVLAAVVAGAGGYSLAVNPAMVTILWAVSGITALVLFFTMRRAVTIKPPVAFIYAITQGAFLGALSRGLEGILASQGIQMAGGSLALQAFVVTAGMVVTMLVLYRARIIRPTAMFQSIITSLVAGIAVVYLITIVLSLFGVAMPFISINSALQGGSAAYIGLGLNAAILIIAALTLIMDFGQIEAAVDSRAPSSVEWYLAFGLTVSMVWIFFEALKLAFRLALIFGNRR